MSELKFYVIGDVKNAPKQLSWNRKEKQFYTKLKHVPANIVCFALGNWKIKRGEVKITIEIGSEAFTIGSMSSQKPSCVGEITPDMFFMDQGDGLKVYVDGCPVEATEVVSPVSSQTEPQSLQETLENTPQMDIESPTDVAKLPVKKERKRKTATELTPNVREPSKKKLPPKNRILSDMFNTLPKPSSKSIGSCKEIEITTTTTNAENTLKENTSKDGANKFILTKIEETERVPSVRWGHSLCLTSDDQAVLIGGQGPRQQLAKDSCWLLNTATKSWTEKATTSTNTGANPETRMGHTATYNPALKCLYVFGGSKHKKWFSDVHVLNCEEWSWQKAEVNGIAPQRAYHSATLYRYEVWVFGGVYPNPDPQPDGCSNDIQIYSPMEQNWYQPIVMGDKPVPRSGHSATLLDDQLVVFGGWDAPVCYNDLHVMDMTFVEWKSLDVKGSPPSPRSWHASCALSGKRIVISGGYNGDEALDDTYLLDLGNMTWTSVVCSSSLSPRVGHTAVCLSTDSYEEDDEVLIFGGGDNDGSFFNDFYQLVIKPIC